MQRRMDVGFVGVQESVSFQDPFDTDPERRRSFVCYPVPEHQLFESQTVSPRRGLRALEIDVSRVNPQDGTT